MTNNYFIIKETQFEKVKKLIIENKKLGMTIIFSNIDDEFSRKVLEKLGKDIDIYLINVSNRKDKQKQRESGFNHVLAKICQKQNITLGINLDEIIDSENLKEKSDILGRIRQNIVLANKNNMKMNFISLKKENGRNTYDLKSLGLVLGMKTSIIKEFE